MLNKIALFLNVFGYFLLLGDQPDWGIICRFVSDVLFLPSLRKLYFEYVVLSWFYLIIDFIFLFKLITKKT